MDKNHLMNCEANEIGQNFKEYIVSKIMMLTKEGNLNEKEINVMVNCSLINIIISTVKEASIGSELQSKKFIKQFSMILLEYVKNSIKHWDAN